MKYKFKFNGIIEFEGDLVPQSEDSSELIKTMTISSMTFHSEEKEKIEEKDGKEEGISIDHSGILPYFKPLDQLLFKENKIFSLSSYQKRNEWEISNLHR